jgi:hypothetical protein
MRAQYQRAEQVFLFGEPLLRTMAEKALKTGAALLSAAHARMLCVHGDAHAHSLRMLFSELIY